VSVDNSIEASASIFNSRRSFFKNVCGAAALGSAAIALEPTAAKAQEPDTEIRRGLTGDARANASRRIRVDSAAGERDVPIPSHPTNGDDTLYANKIGSYSKGLPHNGLGEVDLASYQSLLHALKTCQPSDFESMIMGGNVLMTDPQAGAAYDLEGTDSHQLAIPPSPALASAQRAGEMVENYWQALLRDVPFSQYGTNPLAQAAIDDLNKLSDFRGPEQNGCVTPQTLFRGFTAGDLIGPYLSQFFVQPVNFGALSIAQTYNTYLPGIDYMTDFPSWLAVQNGQGPFAKDMVDPQPRYLRCGRDLSAFVHVDVLYQAYFMACLWLIDHNAPLNPGNPYLHSKTQAGFGTFGAPHIKALMAEVASRALKAVWYQKWFVHRALRPEEYGGLVQNRLTGAANYPLHSDVLNSNAVEQVYNQHNSYLLPMAFPEGCPQHPSYGAGHATVAGACVTILKAWFNDTFVIPNPVVPSDDGLSLLPYTGSDADQMTVAGELNKIAANVAIGRNHAGVHWRSDYRESLLLGEAVAISILKDQRPTYNEDFQGFTFTKFDGTSVTV
jgi:membrane-associated phospholipid phosphatase